MSSWASCWQATGHHKRKKSSSAETACEHTVVRQLKRLYREAYREACSEAVRASAAVGLYCSFSVFSSISAPIRYSFSYQPKVPFSFVCLFLFCFRVTPGNAGRLFSARTRRHKINFPGSELKPVSGFAWGCPLQCSGSVLGGCSWWCSRDHVVLGIKPSMQNLLWANLFGPKLFFSIYIIYSYINI